MFNTGFPPEWSTLKKLVWLVGSGIAGAAAGIWKTVTGSLIHITDALASPMQKCEVTLEPIQDLHGQDAPYPAGGGKNKFDIGTSASDYQDSDSVLTSINGNTLSFLIKTNSYTRVFRLQNQSLQGEHTISYTASKRGSRLFVRLRKLDDSGWMTGNDASIAGMTYLATFNGWYANSDGENLNVSKTITIPECLYWQFGIGYNNNFVTAGNTETISKIQIELGTTATPWSPFANICPITGWTGCEVWNDPKYGGLINFNQMAREFSNDYWQIEQDVTVSYSDGVAEFSNPNANANGIMTRNQKRFVQNHKYIISCEAQSPNVIGSNYVRIGAVSSANVLADFGIDVVDTWIPIKTYETCARTIDSRIYAYVTSVAYTLKVRNLCIFDLTEMFGEGNEPSTAEEFEALFPKDYYEYNAGTETTVSAVNGDPYQHLSVTFPDSAGTVYGGTVDLVSGVLTVKTAVDTVTRTSTLLQYSASTKIIYVSTKSLHPTWSTAAIKCSHYKGSTPKPYIASGNSNTNVWLYITDEQAQSETVVEDFQDWLDEQENNGTPLQIQYKLSTPLTYQLTPQEISTLKGVNNVWSNTNSDTTIIYKAQAT